MKKVKLKALILASFIFLLIGCGGGSSSAKKMWRITQDNAVQTYNSITLAVDSIDVLKRLFEINSIEKNNSCYQEKENLITFNNCKTNAYWDNVTYNGSIEIVQDTNNSMIIKPYGLNITVENQNNRYRYNINFNSGTIKLHILDYKISKASKVSMELYDSKGNSVKWDNFSYYEENNTTFIHGYISSSIINNEWLQITPSTKIFSKFENDIKKIKGLLVVEGYANTTLKVSKKSFDSQTVEVYVNNELIDELDYEEFKKKYNKRNEYLKK